MSIIVDKSSGSFYRKTANLMDVKILGEQSGIFSIMWQPLADEKPDRINQGKNAATSWKNYRLLPRNIMLLWYFIPNNYIQWF